MVKKGLRKNLKLIGFQGGPRQIPIFPRVGPWMGPTGGTLWGLGKGFHGKTKRLRVGFKLPRWWLTGVNKVEGFFWETKRAQRPGLL